MIINKTPLTTSNSYKVNNLIIDDNIITEPKKFEYTLTPQTGTKCLQPKPFNLKNEMGDKITKQSLENSNFNLNLLISQNPKEPIVIRPITNSLVANIKITLTQNITSSIIIDLDSKLTFSNIRLLVDQQKNSNLNIAVINKTKNSFFALESDIAENANLNIFVFDFSQNISAQNINFSLNESNCSSNLYSIYFGENQAQFDLNYLNKIYGANCKSNIQVVGALKDCSSKSFKGTIDFIKGSKSSQGDENEYCMLLSKKATSKALPMLLCTEEDVDGKHSTATGQIDEKQLFYLMSRGFSKPQAQKLIVLTKFNNVINQLFDENLKNNILEIIDRKFE